jgi:hypothetical protein
MEQIAVWVAIGLAAKILADVLRRRFGFEVPGRFASAGRGIETDLAYLIAFAIALFTVRQIGLHAALIIAVVLRLGDIAGDRVLLTSNHKFLELYMALVCLRLHDTPLALAAVLQVMALSVWLYAAFQKVYHREYHDGSYFYFMMQRARSRLGTWTAYIQTVPAIEGYYGAIDAPAQVLCRRLAMLVVLTETVLPLLAFAASGTIWSTLLLLAVAMPVGLLTSETNFMITNVLLAAAFLAPFTTAALSRGLGDPVVATVVGWCLVWPPMHAMLARRLRFSPWRLGGWGMYARQVARIDIILPDGELKTLRGPTMPAGLLREFGACRVDWLREALHRVFFRSGYTEPAHGLVFRWYRLRGDRFVTDGIVFPHPAGGAAQTFEIGDEPDAAAFRRYVASLPHAPASAPRAAVTGVPGVARNSV